MQANRDNFPARDAFKAGQAKYALGRFDEAIALLRQAVLLYAEMDSPKTTYLFLPNLREERALACETCADYLVEAERLPEAANLYQEAIDVYQTLNNHAAKAEQCARKAVAAINILRARPEERLQLLIARHERNRQQLAMQANTEEAQARILMEVGQICVRRERYAQARESYEEALRLLLVVAPAALPIRLLKGECHHQLGNLAFYRFQDLPCAEKRYRAALENFEKCEGFEEYERAAKNCHFALSDVMALLGGVASAPFASEEPE